MTLRASSQHESLKGFLEAKLRGEFVSFAGGRRQHVMGICNGEAVGREALSTVWARSACRRVGEFDVQELANIAWAFATSQHDVAVGREAAYGAATEGGAAGGRVQCAGACQHGMGVRNGEAFGREAVCGIGQGGGASGGRVQCERSRQHCMGFCNGEAFGREAVYGAAAGGGAADGRVQHAEAKCLANTAWAFATSHLCAGLIRLRV